MLAVSRVIVTFSWHRQLTDSQTERLKGTGLLDEDDDDQPPLEGSSMPNHQLLSGANGGASGPQPAVEAQVNTPEPRLGQAHAGSSREAAGQCFAPELEPLNAHSISLNKADGGREIVGGWPEAEGPEGPGTAVEAKPAAVSSGVWSWPEDSA